MTIIAARQGHPNYEHHIEKILEELRQILSGENDRISYPVGTNNPTQSAVRKSPTRASTFALLNLYSYH